VVFLLTEFALRQQNSVLFIFRCALIFVDTYAHTLYLKSNFNFQFSDLFTCYLTVSLPAKLFELYLEFLKNIILLFVVFSLLSCQTHPFSPKSFQIKQEDGFISL
jgi:hypothetical protein